MRRQHSFPALVHMRACPLFIIDGKILSSRSALPSVSQRHGGRKQEGSGGRGPNAEGVVLLREGEDGAVSGAGQGERVQERIKEEARMGAGAVLVAEREMSWLELLLGVSPLLPMMASCGHACECPVNRDGTEVLECCICNERKEGEKQEKEKLRCLYCGLFPSFI